MRVLVCGGRDFNVMHYIFAVLNNLHSQHQIVSIVHGCATGADKWASLWARINNIKEERFPANWQTYGKRAGPMRNLQMIQTKPDLVVAFPGGRGTENLIKIATNHNIKVLRY